jgi:ankyrin repeat protein
VDVLLDINVDINQPSGDGTTPLLMAAINGQFDLAPKLIERGADPNIVSNAGTSPLFAVLERKWAPKASYAHPIEHQQQQATHLDVIATLLEAGADPNIRMNQHLWYTEHTFFVMSSGGIHYSGATPFWRATQALDLDAMRLLKEYGAKPDIANIKRPKRRRPMDQTADPEEPVKEEVDHSGLPPIPDGGPSLYPIHLAAGAGYGQYFVGTAHQYVPGNWLPAVKFLVEECGADVNLRDANGYTALHHAASRGDNKVITYLLDKGADVAVVSRKGQTTVDMANGPIERVIPYPKTIDLLEQLGAKNNNNCMSC